MGGLTTALLAATSGLRAAQTGIDLVSRNVANATTVGYTRKTIVQTPLIVGGEGQGVRLGDIERNVNARLQVEVRSAPRLMMRLWGRGISAMTLPNTIYVDPKVLTRSQGPGPLLVHELIHARQWRKLGVARFLWRYLAAYLSGRMRGLGHRAAYLAIPLEVEARAAALLME